MSVPSSSFWSTLLSSIWTSRVVMPASLMRGVTVRMMPMSLYSMVPVITSESPCPCVGICQNRLLLTDLDLRLLVVRGKDMRRGDHPQPVIQCRSVDARLKPSRDIDNGVSEARLNSSEWDQQRRHRPQRSVHGSSFRMVSINCDHSMPYLTESSSVTSARKTSIKTCFGKMSSFWMVSRMAL